MTVPPSFVGIGSRSADRRLGGTRSAGSGSPGSSTDPDTAVSDGRVAHIDRLLGWVLALCGVVIVLAAGSRVRLTPAQFAPWWAALAFGTVGILLVLVVTGRILPNPWLRVLWISAVVATVAAQATVFAGYTGGDPDTLRPWVWALEPIMMCFVALLARWPVVLGYIVLSPLLPVLSGAVFLGRIPHEAMLQAPVHLGNGAFVAIIYGIRAGLLERERVAERNRRISERRAQARSVAERQQVLARIVHDEVLSTLIAATRLPGEPVPELRVAARTALQALERAAAGPGASAEIAVPEAVERLAAAARRCAPGAEVRIGAVRGAEAEAVPGAMLDAAAAAMSEALRNSVVHAPGSRLRVRGRLDAARLRLTIADDGPGFDEGAIPEERLGVRESILGRMRALPGGTASVRADAAGTVVELGWRR